MTVRWGVAATVKAPLEQVLAFVAWYLDLGAARIWLHFDDPLDTVATAFDKMEAVQVVRCHRAYWAQVADMRPPRHQQRQTMNINRVLRRTGLPWVLHADVDEFLQSRRPVGDILAELEPERLILRAEPWEALHAPDLPDDIFTASQFRRALPPHRDAQARKLYGSEGGLLERGMLSHTVGKCFFRSNVAGFTARIHGARQNGEVVPGGAFHPDFALLHFHAQDRADWLARLPFRLEQGAYQFRPEMQLWLQAASPAEVARFYDAVQNPSPAIRALLKENGFLAEALLNLRARVAKYFPQLTQRDKAEVTEIP